MRCANVRSYYTRGYCTTQRARPERRSIELYEGVVMEPDRHLEHKGRKMSMASIMQRRMKVMSPEVAENAEDIKR